MCFLLDLEWKVNLLSEKLFSPFTVIKSISILSRSLSSQSTERITFSISFQNDGSCYVRMYFRDLWFAFDLRFPVPK